MIEGVRVKRLKVIPDERGRLMEILRRDEDYFKGFGQVYVSTCYPGIVKGWHYHKRQTDNIAVVSGMAKVVLHDLREDSPTRWDTEEYFIGVHNPTLIQIPPMVAHGLRAIDSEAVFVNCPTEPYDYKEPDEYRIDPYKGEIEYDWRRRDR